jgi:arsenate reductase (thioredoxin)
MVKKINVLFLCTGNTARSQMAEAFLRYYGADRFEAHSVGLEPSVINPFTIRVLQEVGIDTEDHYSKGLDKYLGKVHFGYLITVCDRAERNCAVFPGVSNREFWPFPDPAAFEGDEEEKLAYFRLIRDHIQERVVNWLAALA